MLDQKVLQHQLMHFSEHIPVIKRCMVPLTLTSLISLFTFLSCQVQNTFSVKGLYNGRLIY